MDPLLALKQQGQSHWKDDLRREMFQDGSRRHRVHEAGLTSVISNPAICNLAIAGNDWCVSDVGVGALPMRWRRWRTMPWIVVAFGIMIGAARSGVDRFHRHSADRQRNLAQLVPD